MIAEMQSLERVARIAMAHEAPRPARRPAKRRHGLVFAALLLASALMVLALAW